MSGGGKRGRKGMKGKFGGMSERGRWAGWGLGGGQDSQLSITYKLLKKVSRGRLKQT